MTATDGHTDPNAASMSPGACEYCTSKAVWADEEADRWAAFTNNPQPFYGYRSGDPRCVQFFRQMAERFRRQAADPNFSHGGFEEAGGG